MKKENLELKVGLFVLVGLGLLGLMVFKAGDFYLKPGYTVRFIFDFVSGVDNGSPVRLSGVNVGEVKEIHIMRNSEGKTEVEVLAWIAQGVFIEEDADVRVNTLGLLGEKYVEILPGTRGAKTLSDGDTLIGRDPIMLEKLTESGQRLISKIEYTFDNINKVVGDEEFKKGLKGTFVNAEVVAKNLGEASEDIKGAAKSARIVLERIEKGEGSVGRLLTNDKMARDLEDLAADIKKHPWKLFKRG